ncbi:MAG TPA: YceH family protein [Burkholderiales bacterium]|nr:YceH family protein [Burkholderiales bacterium]
MPALSLLETRVLGVLVEKERTVPDSYPLSLNALTLGCNQKNNRDPLMQATEAEVQAAVDALRPLSLVIESSGSRVMRYAHNLGRVLHVPEPAVALLAALMLRGPQTPGELRIATERLHRFADLGGVEAALRELAGRAATEGGSLVVQLPRQPGAREQRWAHLLSGPVEAVPSLPPAVAVATSSAPDATAAEIATLRAELTRLAAETAELRAIVERIARDLGAPR